MRPLLSKDIAKFCSRFDNFIDAEIRSFEVISKDVIRVVIATQDSSREFDWITIILEFSGVSDAKLIKHGKLSFVDISDGLTILSQKDLFLFAIGNYENISGIKNAISYIISSGIKYKEGQF